MIAEAGLALLISLVSLGGTIVGILVGAAKLFSFMREQREKLVVMAREQGEREGALNVKIDTLWAVYTTGARQDARRLGVVRSQSPDRVNPDLAAALRGNGLGDRLVHFYHEQQLAQRPDPEAIFLLARYFHDELVMIGDTFGATLWGALQYCKEEVQHGSEG